MKASEAMIAWNDLHDFRNEGRPGSIAVGPLLFDGDSDWTRPYLYTGGAAEVYRRSLSAQDQQIAVLKDFHTLVHVHGLHPYLVHSALMHIDEYQAIVKEAGAAAGGIESGEASASSDIRMDYPVPAFEEHREQRSHHFRLAE